MVVGEIFKTVRKTLDISQQEVGQLLFSDKSRLSKFENGKLGAKDTHLMVRFSDLYSQLSIQKSLETNINYNERIKQSLLDLIEGDTVPEYLKKFDVSTASALYLFITKFCDFVSNPQSISEHTKEKYSTSAFLTSRNSPSLKRNLAISFGFNSSDPDFMEHHFYFESIKRFDLYDKNGDYVTFRWLNAKNISNAPVSAIFHRTYAEYDLESADLNVRAARIDKGNILFPLENIDYIKKPLNLPENKENFGLWGFNIKFPFEVAPDESVQIFITSTWKKESRFFEPNNFELSMSLLPYPRGIGKIEYGFMDPAFNGMAGISKFQNNHEERLALELKKSSLNELNLYNRYIPKDYKYESIYYWEINDTDATGYVANWKRSNLGSLGEENHLLLSVIMKRDLESAMEIIRNSKINPGTRALIYAVRFELPTVVKMLLDRNVDVNVKDVYGRTALSWAIELGQQEIAMDLISRGAKAQDQRTTLAWGH